MNNPLMQAEEDWDSLSSPRQSEAPLSELPTIQTEIIEADVMSLKKNLETLRNHLKIIKAEQKVHAVELKSFKYIEDKANKTETSFKKLKDKFKAQETQIHTFLKNSKSEAVELPANLKEEFSKHQDAIEQKYAKTVVEMMDEIKSLKSIISSNQSESMIELKNFVIGQIQGQNDQANHKLQKLKDELSAKHNEDIVELRSFFMSQINDLKLETKTEQDHHLSNVLGENETLKYQLEKLQIELKQAAAQCVPDALIAHLRVDLLRIDKDHQEALNQLEQRWNKKLDTSSVDQLKIIGPIQAEFEKSILQHIKKIEDSLSKLEEHKASESEAKATEKTVLTLARREETKRNILRRFEMFFRDDKWRGKKLQDFPGLEYKFISFLKDPHSEIRTTTINNLHERGLQVTEFSPSLLKELSDANNIKKGLSGQNLEFEILKTSKDRIINSNSH